MREHGIEVSDGVTGYGWTNPEVLTLVYDELCAEAGTEIPITRYWYYHHGAEENQILCCSDHYRTGRLYPADVFIDEPGVDALLARLAGVQTGKGSDKTKEKSADDC